VADEGVDGVVIHGAADGRLEAPVAFLVLALCREDDLRPLGPVVLDGDPVDVVGGDQALVLVVGAGQDVAGRRGRRPDPENHDQGEEHGAEDGEQDVGGSEVHGRCLGIWRATNNSQRRRTTQMPPPRATMATRISPSGSQRSRETFWSRFWTLARVNSSRSVPGCSPRLCLPRSQAREVRNRAVLLTCKGPRSARSRTQPLSPKTTS